MFEIIEWIDGKIKMNELMIGNKDNPLDFDIFLVNDNEMFMKIKVELLKGESRKNGDKR